MTTEKEVICNFCGCSCDLLAGYKEHEKSIAMDNAGLINALVGGHYNSQPGNGDGALDDLTSYKFSLCEWCLDWLFSRFAVPVEVRNHGATEKFRPADMRVLKMYDENNSKREYVIHQKKKFFDEKFRRDEARQKAMTRGENNESQGTNREA